jgi:hypothetical protein
MLGVEMPVDENAIKSLSSALMRPTFRKEFSAAPLSALDRAGINTAGVPSPILESLAEMSFEELTAIGRAQQRLELANDPDLAGFTGGVIF